MCKFKRLYLVALAILVFSLPLPLSLANVDAQVTAPGADNPPHATCRSFGKIARLMSRAKVIDKTQFGQHGAIFIGALPGGELYFEVPTMDVDDDGDVSRSPAHWVPHPVRSGKIDLAHQDQTSYGGQLPQRTGRTDGISPFEVPYIVLPGGKGGQLWFAKHGIKLGDGAMIVRGGTYVEAVFADVGPSEKIGEMSIKAHQLFGEAVMVAGKKARLDAHGAPLLDPINKQIVTDPAIVTRNSGSKGPFIVIVFPGTSVHRKFVSVDISLKSTIDQRFQTLVK